MWKASIDGNFANYVSTHIDAQEKTQIIDGPIAEKDYQQNVLYLLL
jgi:hypothetical protein